MYQSERTREIVKKRGLAQDNGMQVNASLEDIKQLNSKYRGLMERTAQVSVTDCSDFVKSCYELADKLHVPHFGNPVKRIDRQAKKLDNVVDQLATGMTDLNSKMQTYQKQKRDESQKLNEVRSQVFEYDGVLEDLRGAKSDYVADYKRIKAELGSGTLSREQAAEKRTELSSKIEEIEKINLDIETVEQQQEDFAQGYLRHKADLSILDESIKDTKKLKRALSQNKHNWSNYATRVRSVAMRLGNGATLGGALKLLMDIEQEKEGVVSRNQELQEITSGTSEIFDSLPNADYEVPEIDFEGELINDKPDNYRNKLLDMVRQDVYGTAVLSDMPNQLTAEEPEITVDESDFTDETPVVTPEGEGPQVPVQDGGNGKDPHPPSDFVELTEGQ